MPPASGRPTAITCTVTLGASSDTAATELAAGPSARAGRGDAPGSERGPGPAGLARASGGTACGRSPDGGGWLPGAAELLDRVTPRRQRAAGADRRTTGRR